MRDRKGQTILFTGSPKILDEESGPTWITIIRSIPADLFQEATVHECILTNPCGKIRFRTILEPIAGWPMKTYHCP